jgi:DNA-binding NarL/FixJ family response regulator
VQDWLRRRMEDAGAAEVVACRGSIAEACASAPDAPVLVVVDGDTAEAALPEGVETLAQRYPESTLVARGRGCDPALVDAVLSAGAIAYLPDSYDERQVRLVLELAMTGAGHRPLSPDPLTAPMDPSLGGVPDSATTTAPQPAGPPRLTPRQVEVLALVASGLPNRQIGLRLGIGENTVKVHLTDIFHKLNVENRGQAILAAQRLDEVRRHLVDHGQRGTQVLDCLTRHFTHRRHQGGEIIFRKGDPGDELYYLQRGTVTLVEIGVELGPGEIFGEIGVFAPERRRTCTARCKTDVDLFCLDSEQVRSAYYSDPQFALRIATLLAQRLLAERMG